MTAFGRVSVPGVTPGVGAGAGLRAQVGVGSSGDNASTSAAWGWREAGFNADIAATGEDEYSAVVQPAYSGGRALAFRVSVDDGFTWRYCDKTGLADAGYDPTQQWDLAVGNTTALGWCGLQFPPTADAGTIIYGQVYEPNVTPNPGADPSITAQLGYGKKIEDPGASAGWKWVTASHNPTCSTCGNNDEYKATLSSAPQGSYAYAYRFTRDGGSFCFADLDGAANGFSGDKAGSPSNLGQAVIP